MEDRSALFNQLKEFSQRKLKKVETKVVTGLGENLVEKRGAKGLQVLSGGATGGAGAEVSQEPARKLDLQVGFVLPGLLMGSQDVAHDKSSLESYGIEYILNLDAAVENKFEDDYNYKNVPIRDTADFELNKVLDECFDFIDDGRHRSNVFVHCSGTVGLSRTTAICVAYLMNKEKQSFNDAFGNVKEARSFVKPNEGFIKQLRDYEVKLRGAQAVKESGIDDPFALRKKQEIEQEKAMVAGAASVKNRMKMFGATLDAAGSATASPRSKSVSPMPGKADSAQAGSNSSSNSSSSAASKWGAGAKPGATTTGQAPASKSMTPEPRKWSARSAAADGPPPPPPPMPATPLHANDKPTSTRTSTTTTTTGSFPPPPPPPPPPGDSLLKNGSLKSSSPHTTSPVKPPPPSSSSSSSSSATTASQQRPPKQRTSAADTKRPSISESSDDEGRQKMVFGRRPPPPMKIRGGLSIERNDDSLTTSDKQAAPKTHRQPGQLNLELAREALSNRCPSPLVLMNNVTPSPPALAALARPSLLEARPTGQQQQQQQQHMGSKNSLVVEELEENPFDYWQRTLRNKPAGKGPTAQSYGQAPKRTVSLGPRRQVGSLLQQSPFLREPPPPPASGQLELKSDAMVAPAAAAAAAARRESTRTRNISENFDRAARELQSSLTELDQLIRSPEIGSSATLGRRPKPKQTRANLALPGPQPRATMTASIGLHDNDDETDGANQRWQWQEDLTNWKLSTSVNDLRSMFNQPTAVAPPASRLPPPSAKSPQPPAQGHSLRPPSSASILAASNKPPPPPPSLSSTLKRNPWLDGSLTSNDGSKEPSRDYTIRRTTSVSSSSLSSSLGSARPVLRNPYRGQY